MEQPIGKKVTSTDPISGALSFIGMMRDMALDRDVSGRATAMTDEIGDITVDTCVPSGTNVWETGIFRKSMENIWIIVSQYILDEEAKEGHKQWVAYLKENPTCELKDINSWNIPSMGETDE